MLINKCSKILLVLLILLFVFPVFVNAKTNDYNIKESNYIQINEVANNMANDECSAILGNVDDETSTAWLINKILNYIKILGPTLALLLGSIDFAKAVITSDQEDMKKTQSKFIKRIIAAVCIFFVPLITQIVLDLTGLTNAGVDATCGINQHVGGE